MTGIINLNQTETQIIYSSNVCTQTLALAIFLEVLAITHGLLLSLLKIYRAKNQTPTKGAS